jgi:lipopolysaccharide export LptBFGC system permease protein LptF
MLDATLKFLTPERLSAAFVYIVGSIVGAYAAQGLSPLQWVWAAVSILGAVSIAVMVRMWPVKAKAKA